MSTGERVELAQSSPRGSTCQQAGSLGRSGGKFWKAPWALSLVRRAAHAHCMTSLIANFIFGSSKMHKTAIIKVMHARVCPNLAIYIYTYVLLLLYWELT